MPLDTTKTETVSVIWPASANCLSASTSSSSLGGFQSMQVADEHPSLLTNNPQTNVLAGLTPVANSHDRQSISKTCCMHVLLNPSVEIRKYSRVPLFAEALYRSTPKAKSF
jgi:hypothetical protein